MSETETRDRAGYDKTREAFRKLDMQDKAAFVLEATFSTFGEAFKDAGQQFADVVEKVSSEDFFKGFAWECGPDTESEDDATKEKPSNGAKPSGSRPSARKKDEDAAD